MSSFNLISVVNTVSPKFESIDSEINLLKRQFPNLTNDELVNKYCGSIINKYTSIGVVTALPSVIPGLGTAAQIATEVGTVGADLLMMLRYMAAICYGTAKIYDKEDINEFDAEFVMVLGLWCGTILPVRNAAQKIGTKVVIKSFNKNISGKMLQVINRKVGFTIFTKYGTKRGGIALGKLIPFGVGALVGGGFNNITMKSFKKAAINKYKSEEEDYILI